MAMQAMRIASLRAQIAAVRDVVAGDSQVLDMVRRAQAAGTGHLLVQRAVRWAGHRSFDGVVDDAGWAACAWKVRDDRASATASARLTAPPVVSHRNRVVTSISFRHGTA